MPFNTQAPWTVLNVVDQILSRAIDGTPYTNNTGKTMFVMVCCNCNHNAAGDQAYIVSYSGGVTSGFIGIMVGNTMTALFMGVQTTFAVKPGDTYGVTKGTTGTGTVLLSSWIEAY